MITLPLPNDVDVSDMPHIPLHDQRLMRSRAWVKAKLWRSNDGPPGPGLGFCLLNIWAAAFRSVPAGSLDDDDDMLAVAAQCDREFWTSIKDQALAGWQRHDGRLWHPVVAELAWALWLVRLKGRHAKAVEGWRSAARRASDRNKAPKDPPGDYETWLRAKFPETAAFQQVKADPGVEAGQFDRRSAGGRPADNVESLADFRTKGSKAKEESPLYPPEPRPADRAMAGMMGPPEQSPDEAKSWFEKEYRRLTREFSGMTPILMSFCNRPGTSSRYGFVEMYKGCWLASGEGGTVEIVAPSYPRMAAIELRHGAELRATWPALRIRHATVDEKRARKGQDQ